MREPRYPLPRVVMNNGRLHGIPRTHHVWGGGSIALLFKFLGAFRAGVRCAAENAPNAPGARGILASRDDGKRRPIAPIEFVTSSLVILLGRIRQ